MKKKADAEQNIILFLTLLTIVGSIFTICYLVITGNENQVYDDVVIETTARLSSNKSAEKLLINLLAFGGIGACCVYYLLTQRGFQPGQIASSAPDYPGRGFVYALFVLGITYYAVYQGINQFLLISAILLAAILLVDKSSLLQALSFYYLSVYALCGIDRIYLAMGGTSPLNGMSIAWLALIISTAILFSGDRKQYFLRGCLISQLFIPSLLLIHIFSRYKQGEEIYHLSTPISVRLLIFLLIGLFTFEAAYALVRNWSKKIPFQKCISFGACVCILAFNSFYSTGAVMSTDMHHPFENIISFSQIFELGRGVFSDYIPSSGLYAVLEGAFFRFFGQDMMANYNLSHNIFFLFIVLITVAVLKPLFSAEYFLLVSLIFPVNDYSRTLFILPMMLLLSMPKLIEKKNLWLKLWLLTSLFYGLYYPLLGAAVCIAYLPLGIFQIVTFVRMPEFKTAVRKASFWAPWAGCLLLVFASAPLLLGTLRHMLAMAGQSILSDGISRFAQIIPDNFLPYLGDHNSIRVAMFDLCTFMMPAVFVWAAFVLTLKTADIQLCKWGLKVRNIQGGCVAVAVVIMPLIAYTFTTTRLDVFSMYGRSVGPLLAGAVMLIVLANRYLEAGRLKCLILCFAIFVPALNAGTGFYNIGSRLSAYYNVPDDYIYVSDHNIKRIGTGFISQSTYDSIETYYKVSQDLDSDASYMGIYPLFGYYYLFDTKGDSTIEIEPTVRGYSAAKETVDILRKNNTIVGRHMNVLTNYYLYHWLVTSGEYVWSEERQMFFPIETGMDREQVWEKNKNIAISGKDYTIKKEAGSLGLSMDSLRNIFTVFETDFTLVIGEQEAQVRFAAPIDGNQADFMYIEFANMDSNYRYVMQDNENWYEMRPGPLFRYLLKKDYNPGLRVVASWQDDAGEPNSVNCFMSEGKLLIPLGIGQKWLLNEHDSLTIRTQAGEEIVSLPEISSIEFLKLREVR